jgi:DNA-directed RNA polymerase subunit RPC12/RpoP
MSMQRLRCTNCGSRNVRPAHIRLLTDILQFVILRLPVRCRYCRERFHVAIHAAFKLRSE